MTSKPTGDQPFGPNYVLGGALEDPEINFRFEVWAPRKLTNAEVDAAFASYGRSQRKKPALKNKTVRVLVERP